MSFVEHSASNFISSQDHRVFLTQMMEDDRLRDELQTNPAETLAKFGITVDPKDLPTRVALPEKSTLLSAVEGDSTSRHSDIVAWLGLIVD